MAAKKAPKSVTDPKVRFFYEHAGFAKSPGESEAAARLRNAKALADAEEYALDHEWTYDWEEESQAEAEMMYGDDESYETVESFTVFLRDENSEILASLGGVSFLREGPASARRDYTRVVEAELALEGMPYEREGGSFEVRTAGSRGVPRPNASRLGELPPDPGGKLWEARRRKSWGAQADAYESIGKKPKLGELPADPGGARWKERERKQWMVGSSTEQRDALAGLVEWATLGNRVGNPYSKPEVRAAIRALGDPEGYDIPETRPRSPVGGALYDLAKWATGSDRTGNPYMHEPVKRARIVLGLT